MKEVIKGV